jgi:asparagine synthase (glutamine-hydrolysing)
MGFAVPLKAWFRGPLRERVRRIVTSGSLVETGLFDVPYLRSLVDQHQSGVSDHSSVIWSLMMFESFLRNTHGELLRLPDAPVRERARAAAG